MASSGSGPSPTPHTRPSFTQVAASTLAAVSATLVSATFGVAGTLIGAAVASVVASVGSTLYLASLRNTNERLRRMAVAARRTDWGATLPTRPLRPAQPAQPTPSTQPPVIEPELPFPGSPEDPASEAAAPQVPSGWSRLRWSNLRRGLPTVRRRWVAVAGLAVLVFVIALAALTAIQASTNQRLTALPPSSGSHHKPAPTTTPTPTPTPSAGPTTTPSPSATPTPSASPSATPSPSPSSPAGATPSATPSPSVGVTPTPTASPATLP